MIVADTLLPAASYSPYFAALTTKLNQSFPFGANPWLGFRLAPTSVQHTIHSLPVDNMPHQDEDCWKCSVLLTILNPTGKALQP